MPDWIIIASVALSYLLIILIVGYKSGGENSTNSMSAYLAGGRKLGFLLMFFIIGAEFYSSATFLGAPGWAYSRGAPALYLIPAFSLSLLPWWWIGVRTARLGKHYGFLTQGDLLGERFQSRTLSALVSIVGMIALLPYLVVQIVGAGYLFSAATSQHIPFWLGALLSFSVVLIYTFNGGLRSIGWTNVAQGIIMLVVAWIIGLTIPIKFYGSVSNMFTQLATQVPEYLTIPGHNDVMSWSNYSSAITIMILGMTMWPHLFNRAYGAGSEDSIKRSIILFPIYGLLLIPILFVGFAGILLVESLENPDQIMITLIAQADLSPWLVGIILSGALAATMSTGANVLHTLASILIKDFYLNIPNTTPDERKQVQLTRLMVILLFIISYFIALDPPKSILSLLLVGFGALAQIMPGVLAAFTWERATSRGVITGLVTGILVTAYYTYMAESPLGIHAGIFGFIVNIIFLISISLTSREADPSRISQFLQIANHGKLNKA